MLLPTSTRETLHVLPSWAFVRAHVDGALAAARLAQGLTAVAHMLPGLWEVPLCGPLHTWGSSLRNGLAVQGPGASRSGTQTQTWNSPLSCAFREKCGSVYRYLTSFLFLITSFPLKVKIILIMQI